MPDRRNSSNCWWDHECCRDMLESAEVSVNGYCPTNYKCYLTAFMTKYFDLIVRMGETSELANGRFTTHFTMKPEFYKLVEPEMYLKLTEGAKRNKRYGYISENSEKVGD